MERVGGWTTNPLSLNATTPILMVDGWSATNVRAAFFAAVSRFGFRSLAFMLCLKLKESKEASMPIKQEKQLPLARLTPAPALRKIQFGSIAKKKPDSRVAYRSCPIPKASTPPLPLGSSSAQPKSKLSLGRWISTNPN